MNELCMFELKEQQFTCDEGTIKDLGLITVQSESSPTWSHMWSLTLLPNECNTVYLLFICLIFQVPSIIIFMNMMS